MTSVDESSPGSHFCLTELCLDMIFMHGVNGYNIVHRLSVFFTYLDVHLFTYPLIYCLLGAHFTFSAVQILGNRDRKSTAWRQTYNPLWWSHSSWNEGEGPEFVSWGHSQELVLELDHKGWPRGGTSVRGKRIWKEYTASSRSHSEFSKCWDGSRRWERRHRRSGRDHYGPCISCWKVRIQMNVDEICHSSSVYW